MKDNVSIKTSTARVVDEICQLIEDGVFVPGQRLVEVDLIEEFGVGRSVLREAFQRLSAEGVVVVIPNRGAAIRRLTAKDAAEIQQIRSVLEPLAAYEAAKSISAGKNRQRLMQAAELWINDPPLHDVKEFVKQNRRFHQLIVSLSGNSQLIPIIERLHLPLLAAHMKSVPMEIRFTTAKFYRELISAILAGDASGARRIMRSQRKFAEKFVRLELKRES